MSYWIVHCVCDRIHNETEKFYGPFSSKDDVAQFLDNRYAGCGQWRDMPKIYKIIQLNSTFTKEFELSSGHYGYCYNGEYFGPFIDQSTLFKVIVDQQNKTLANELQIIRLARC